MAARVPALRLGTRGAKRAPGRRFTPAGTLRKLLVASLKRGPEQISISHSLPRGEISSRDGSKYCHTPESRARLRSRSATKDRTADDDSAAATVPGHPPPTKQAEGPRAGPIAGGRPANALTLRSDAAEPAMSLAQVTAGVNSLDRGGSDPQRNAVRTRRIRKSRFGSRGAQGATEGRVQNCLAPEIRTDLEVFDQ